MIVVVFRSRLHRGVQDACASMAKRISALARTIPGDASHTGFVAEDGERVMIAEFESGAALQQGNIHPEHTKAKRPGLESFFSDNKIQICEVVNARAWELTAAGVR